MHNDFRDNAGALISINANSMTNSENGDVGRQTGIISRLGQYDANRGPLLRGNGTNTVGGVPDLGGVEYTIRCTRYRNKLCEWI